MDKSNFLSDFLYAGISSSIGKTIVAPLERIKLLLQTRAYKGVWTLTATVVRDQGFWSLWRGNCSSIMRYVPMQASNFALKDLFRRKLPKSEDFHRILLTNMLTGGLAAICTTTVSYPLDYTRTRLAVDIGRSKNDREFTGIADLAKKTWKSEGVRGFYRGVFLAMFESIVYRSLYFGFFDSFKKLLPKKEESSFFVLFLLAQCITTFTGLIIYPFDTVRRMLITQVGIPNPQFAGAKDCAIKLYENHGVRRFYKGAFINVLRTTGGALILVIYDKIKLFFTYVYTDIDGSYPILYYSDIILIL